jgi:uncharacterized protein
LKLDARALVRVVSELLWSLRREGFVVAPSQSMDVARAMVLLGFSRRDVVRDAVAALLGVRPEKRDAFDAAFHRFFDPTSRMGLWERLERAGATLSERDAVKGWLDALEDARNDATLAALLEGRGELTRLLASRGSQALLAGADSPLKSGFLTHRLLDRLGSVRAHGDLSALRMHLVDAFGEERAETLLRVLRDELSRTLAEVRGHVRDVATNAERERSRTKDTLDTPFDALSVSEVAEVRRAVRRFVERLRGREEVRRRHARRGKVAAGPTVRRAFRTFGVPVRPVLRARKLRKPRLVLLCDISESVRGVARFLLEFSYLAQTLFEDARSFVFVSDLGETTRLFRDKPLSQALAEAYGGRVVSVASNSNYGRVFRTFVERHVDSVDRRTTVVILGDGRTNYLDDGLDALARIFGRARSVLWLCPEPRASWGQGDSAMERYATKCKNVLEVRSARELEDALRKVAA